jgi:hypothetical protein
MQSRWQLLEIMDDIKVDLPRIAPAITVKKQHRIALRFLLSIGLKSMLLLQ